MSGGGSAGGGYVIERSLRFMAASSQNLTRTATTPTSGTTWSWSGWVKRGALTSAEYGIFGGGTNGTTTYDALYYVSSTNTLQFFTAGAASLLLVTSQVFRDPSAYYHILAVYDSTQATASNRAKLYINGVQVTSFSTANYPAQNTTSLGINANSVVQALGAVRTNAISFPFDGYMSEVHFIDGQALTPSSFGEINPATGQWVAKKYTGTYGNNGSYLDFEDGTSTTTLGNDKSGNNNHWTLTNFTRSAGVNDCWMLDVPSGNGSASAVQPSGNYAVMNRLLLWNTGGSPFNVLNGNLRVSEPGGTTVGSVASSLAFPTTGKWYVECNVELVGAALFSYVGITSVTSAAGYPGQTSTSYSYRANGNKVNASSESAYGASYTSGDGIALAFDADLGELSFYKNGVSQGVAFTGLSGQFYFVVGDFATTQSSTFNVNFGQRSFAYTPPTGFKALCTANLTSTDVIESGSFTGNASADGPFIWCNGTPETLTINGNAVTWGTHADRLANGFKLRTSSSSYNSSGTNTWTATVLSPESKSAFKHQNAKGN